ncbi:hypothetical protein [Mesorhizobium sp. M4B.F.Ca.ET.019.03.1.1]|uniref:hypothetical protein n=1 Tax=Mesorhizobium sp. M4B.F.Ca.ET.019.03.1.1 TaxID=2496651 RepID=UPI000FCC2836|nr:hypothetical protein [Mesorhizobium sp. M4B.F.Ca.ET.019.03.1.1]
MLVAIKVECRTAVERKAFGDEVIRDQVGGFLMVWREYRNPPRLQRLEPLAAASIGVTTGMPGWAADSASWTRSMPIAAVPDVHENSMASRRPLDASSWAAFVR